MSSHRICCCALALATALALAHPAQADQFKQAADGGTIPCAVSAKELTRFSLVGDQFASVSKISSGYPYNDFAVSNEPVRGDIYVSVPETYPIPSSPPISTSIFVSACSTTCCLGAPR